MHIRTRSSRLALALAIGLLVAACGDDEDAEPAESGATTTVAPEEDAGGEGEQAGGDIDAYCSALVEFNTAVFQSEVAEDASPEEAAAVGEELQPLFDEVEANAPEDLAPTAEDLGVALDQLVEGDAAEFNSDATFETYLGLVGDSVPQCGYDNTEVTAVDYAFEGVPAELSAGTQAITLVNESEADEEHEFIVFRKAEGETRSAEELLNDPAAQEQGPGEFVGAAFAPPGESAAALVTLEPGDYIAVCFIPVGGGEDGPPHFTQGMVAEFSVS